MTNKGVGATERIIVCEEDKSKHWQWSVEWGMYCVGYEVGIVECEVSSVKCKAWSAVWSVQCRVWSVKSGMGSVEYIVQSV